MEHINHSPHKFSGTDWQTLGELEVHSDSYVERVIQVWLNDTLQPLDLHSDLLHRILKSACEAAIRTLNFQNASMRFGHIHLLAFAPRNHDAKSQTWGFFRLEKVGADTENEDPRDHSIEFYLYLDGQ
jgi:hypothetical protein